MTFWLGKPGSVLTALPHPGRGIDAELVIPGRAEGTIGGGRAVDRAPTGRRTYELAWKSLSPEQHSIVEEFYVGARGPGPFALIDPWRRNHLTANQSAATSVTNSTTGFTATTPADTLASSSTVFDRGPRGLNWTVAPGSAGHLYLDPPNADWHGVPCVPGRQYRFQFVVKASGTDSTIQLDPHMIWRDAAGTELSTSSAGGITGVTTTGAYQLAYVADAAPAGAVYLAPRVALYMATVSATGTLHLDRFMLSMPSTSDPATVWVLGTGVPLVSCTASPTNYRKPVKRAAGLTLVEVG